MTLAEEKLNELAEEKGFLDRNGVRIQVCFACLCLCCAGGDL
jgi:hypothetical protein